MKTLLLILLLGISSLLTAQITLLKKYSDNEGGIQGLFYPNYITFDSSGENIFLTAYNQVTHLKTNTDFTEFTFFESVKYSSSNMNGLWNASEVLLSPNEKIAYAVGDENLLVFERDETDSLLLIQDFKLSDSLIIGGGVSSHLCISPDKKFLYYISAYGSKSNLILFSIETVTNYLKYHSRVQLDDWYSVNTICASPDNKFVFIGATDNNTPYLYFLKRNSSDSLNIVHRYSSMDSLKNPYRLATSPDGEHLYVIDNGYILTYNILSDSSKLTLNDKFDLSITSSTYYGANDIVISQDGRSIYLATWDNLRTFSRDTATGKVTFLQIVNSDSELRFNSLEKTCLCRNDSFLCAVSVYDSSIYILRREPDSGLLSFYRKITDQQGKIKGLRDAENLFNTNDNRFVYTIADDFSHIGIYNRDSSGYLRCYKILKPNDVGPSLMPLGSCTMSPDNKHLLTSNEFTYSIKSYHRDSVSGDISYGGINNLKETGLSEAYINNMIISPDNKLLFVGANFYLITYGINESDSKLTYLRKYIIKDDLSNGLKGYKQLIVSHDGKNLYTYSNSNFFLDGISVYNIEPDNGTLHFKKNLTSNDGFSFSNDVSFDLVLSPDDNYLYVVGTHIYGFRRNIENGDLTLVEDINFDTPESDIYRLAHARICNDGKTFIGVTNDQKRFFLYYRNPDTGKLKLRYIGKFSNDPNYSSYNPLISFSEDMKNAYILSSYDATLSAYKLQVPIAGFEKDITLCKNDTLNTESSEGYKYYWSTGDTTESILISDPGQYSLYIRDSIGRETWDTVNINLNELPQFSLGADTTILYGNSIILSAHQRFNEYKWSDGSKEKNLHVINKNDSADHQINEIWLRVVDNNGCTHTDTILITFEVIDPQLYCYPNPFSEKITIANKRKNYSSTNAEISIQDLNGKIIFVTTVESKNNIYEIYPGSLKKGIYILRIKTNDSISAIKILKR